MYHSLDLKRRNSKSIFRGTVHATYIFYFSQPLKLESRSITLPRLLSVLVGIFIVITIVFATLYGLEKNRTTATTTVVTSISSPTTITSTLSTTTITTSKGIVLVLK
jgi:hypothetical protein